LLKKFHRKRENITEGKGERLKTRKRESDGVKGRITFEIAEIRSEGV